MDEQTVEQLVESTKRLVEAAEALTVAITQISAQQEEIKAKVEKIVAAIEEGSVMVSANNPTLSQQKGKDGPPAPALSATEAERTGHPDERTGQVVRHSRKTLSPLVTMILAKSGVEEGTDAAVLDKALSTLTPEQRIAVKSEMARAGIIQ